MANAVEEREGQRRQKVVIEEMDNEEIDKEDVNKEAINKEEIDKEELGFDAAGFGRERIIRRMIGELPT